MVRLREFEDRTVLEAARWRLERTLHGFDRLAVAFSGGKDSLATLRLVHEAQQAHGDTRPVLAFFRDQQYVNTAVIEKVAEVATREWVDLQWIATRQNARTVVLGQPQDVPLWEPAEFDAALASGRLPQNALLVVGGAEEVDEVVVRLHPGRIGIVTGVRAAESLIRYRAIVNKLSESWIAVSAGRKHVPMVRPIYDWHENDVLRYLLDNGEDPAAIYHAQAWNDTTELRTASLLAAEQMRDLDRLRATDPDAFDTVVGLIPNAATALRYTRDLADPHLKGADCTTYAEVTDWILGRFPDTSTRKQAFGRLEFARGLAKRNPRGFPAWWVQHEIARMGHGTGMMPLPTTHPRYTEEPPR